MDEVTLGELARRMDALHGDVREMRRALVEHDDLTAISDGWKQALQAHERLADARMARAEARVSSLESTQAWLVRTIVAIILVAVIGAFIVDPFKVG